MANYNRVTESKYRAIKTLLNGGATAKEAAEYMACSEVTVYAIKKTENYTEFVNARTERTLSYKKTAKKEEQVVTDDKQKGGTISANYQLNRIYELLKQQTETLTLISNKLAYIVEELTK